MPKLIETVAGLIKVRGTGVIKIESTTVCSYYPLSYQKGAQISADLIIAVGLFNDTASPTVAQA